MLFHLRTDRARQIYETKKDKPCHYVTGKVVLSWFSLVAQSDSVNPWTVAQQASLSITNSWSLLKLMSIELVMPSTISSSVVPFSFHLQSFPESGSFPMNLFFELGSQIIRASVSASVLPMYIQLISFRMDWLDLLEVQGTSKSLLQHHSSKASILWRSAFFLVQLSHPHMITGKTTVLIR